MRNSFALLLLLMVATPAWSEVTITGTLINGSDSQSPGSADQVVLFDLSKGMMPVNTAASVSGDFTLTHEEGEFQADRYMIQALKGTVMYSLKLAAADEPVSITVYDNSEEATINARVGSLAFFAYEGGLDVGIFYNVDNVSDPPVTYTKNGATFTFPIYSDSQNLEVSTNRGTLPLKQNVTIEGNRASMSYALKPGRTQVMVRNSLAYNGDNEYVLDLLPQQEFMHVLIMPMGMKVEGENLNFAGPDQKNGVDLYEFARNGSDQFRLRISGKAPARAQTEGARVQSSQNSQQNESNASLQPTNTPDRISGYRWLLLAGVLVVFGIIALISTGKS